MSDGVGQRGAGSCDAENGLASYCSGLHIPPATEPVLQGTIYARSVTGSSSTTLAATKGHYLGCNNGIGGFHENLVNFRDPELPSF